MVWPSRKSFSLKIVFISIAFGQFFFNLNNFWAFCALFAYSVHLSPSIHPFISLPGKAAIEQLYRVSTPISFFPPWGNKGFFFFFGGDRVSEGYVKIIINY